MVIGDADGEFARSADMKWPWTRRELLQTLGWTLGAAACRPTQQGNPRSVGARFDGFPIQRVDSFLTPTADFFVRDHFGVPDVAERAGDNWTLRVDGDVEASRTLSLAELAMYPKMDVPVTLECAGNAGRNGLGWPGGPRAWGGASTASFQGISLAALLQLARPRSGAREVVLFGADIGAERGSSRVEPFARSVPLASALAGPSILATGMNGARLPTLHGGPLRAVFPGRYATDSVKWLARISILSTPFSGLYQAHRYRRATRLDPVGTPLGELRLQNEIVRPLAGAQLPAGLLTDVMGVTWGGVGGVERVDVSVDGGQSFVAATFIDPDRPNCWRRWTWPWKPEHPGPRLLLARAVDRSGEAQPMASEEERGLSYSVSGPDRIQYANNSVPVIPVTVT